MKIKKIVLLLILIIPTFFVTVKAEQSGLSQEEFYKQQLELSGADEIENALPEQAKEYLAENEIDLSDYNWVNKLSADNVFKHIFGFVVSGGKAPLNAGIGALGIILISSALTATENKSSAITTAIYATTIATAAVIAVPVFSVISASVNAMKGVGVFMLSFIPIFAVTCAASGAVFTSASMSALLLTATQVINYISNFAVLPLMGGYLAISVSASVSPLVGKSEIAGGIKKISFWIISLMTTVFVGILGIQTAVNASADNLSVKTAKFIIGSAVPVAGTALSEALTTVTASMGLLKSSVGIYGVVACCVIFLPLLIELLLWRVVLMVTSCVSEIFSLSKISSLLKAIDMMMSVLVGIILLTGAMFIISLTVVITVGKT